MSTDSHAVDDVELPSATALRRAMGRLATGVTIILTGGDKAVHGMTANAVSSVSLDPPLILICLDNRSKMRALLTESVGFSVNVLDASQAAAADQFANRWAWTPDAPALAVLLDTPVLADSLVRLVCHVETVTPAGDHTIILGRVVGLNHRPGSPLLFFEGKWKSLPGTDDVFLLDRSRFRQRLKDRVPRDVDSMALVSIDMTRRHLDASVATMPVPALFAEPTITRAQAVMQAMRRRRRPVIHVSVTFNPEEAARNPFLKAVDDLGASLIPWSDPSRRVEAIDWDVQAEVIDAVAPIAGEFLVTNKRRHGAFFKTNLDEVLASLDVSTLVLMGVNTNTSILHTAFEAFCRDYTVVVLSDCAVSIYGPDLHDLALRNIEYTLGWVSTADEFLAVLDCEGEHYVGKASYRPSS